MINAYTLSRLGMIVFAAGIATLVYAESFSSAEFWLGTAGMVLGCVMPFTYREFWPRNSKRG